MDASEFLERATAPEPDWRRADDGHVRFAVVGLGRFATEHALPALVEAARCEPTVLVSGSPATARDVAATHGVGTTLSYEQYHDGAEAIEYDAVYVATPNALHLETVETAAELGKDVVCEKPLESTPERARRLVEACERAGVTLMTAYRMQAHPVVRRLREALAEGLIGEPVQIHSDFSVVRTDPDAWQLDPELGGGALPDVGVYPLNTSRFLLNRDPEAVQGTTASVRDRFAEVDERVTFELTFPGGTLAACSASHFAARHNRLLVLGTEGRVTIDPAYDIGGRRTVEIEHDGTCWTLSTALDEVRLEFEHFADCVLTGETPDPDGRDGLCDVEAIAAVYEAAESGSRIVL